MKIDDLYEAVSGNLLYHAVNPERAVRQLADDKILGYTFQRVWPDGVRRKEDDPEYENHWQLKGISATRDFSFAKMFGPVVYIFDKDKLKHNFKIVPYNWGFHIGGGYVSKDNKREREEFVVFNVLKKSFDELEKEWMEWVEENDEKEEPEEFINRFDYLFAPSGELKNLSKYLRGIMLDEDMIDIYGEEGDIIKNIMSHPKFKGTFKR